MFCYGRKIFFMEQTAQYNISDFSPHLFWDVDRSNMDWEKNARFIIERTLEYGLLQDWNLLRNYYGLERIGAVALNIRYLDPKTLAFVSVVTGLPKEKFRCYSSEPSRPEHWVY